MMSSVKYLNPYRAGSGLFPSCLAGRKAALSVFSSRLYSTITGSPRNIIVYGKKRMGKTCFLMQMENISFEKKLVTVSTITTPDTVKGFIDNLAARIYAEMKSLGFLENGVAEDVLKELHSLSEQVKPAEWETVFKELMLTIWNNIEDKVPALFISIDDLDLVEDAEKALFFIHNVTQLLHRKNCPVIFAISISTDFYEEQLEKNEKFIESFQALEAEKLKMSSLQNTIRVPLSELEINYDESVVTEIARLSDGYPYYVQHIAHHVFEEMSAEFDTLALRRGFEKAFQYLKRDIFAPIEKDLPLNEKTIYTAVFKSGVATFSEIVKRVKLPRGSVASCLKRLKGRQLLLQDDKKYSVADSLFGEYLEKRMEQGGNS